MPECNLIIGDDRGPIGRVDLVYLAYKLIIEYEGDQHRTDRNQWNRDITVVRTSHAISGR
jgi:very-short-patch-repair endonuclease